MAVRERSINFASGESAAILGGAVEQALRAGAAREDLMTKLESFRVRSLRDGRDEDLDAVIEVMERLDGWCATAARL